MSPTQALGKMINRTALGSNNLQMAISMKAILKMGSNTDKELSHGQMGWSTKGNFEWATYGEKVF